MARGACLCEGGRGAGGEGGVPVRKLERRGGRRARGQRDRTKERGWVCGAQRKAKEDGEGGAPAPARERAAAAARARRWWDGGAARRQSAVSLHRRRTETMTKQLECGDCDFIGGGGARAGVGLVDACLRSRAPARTRGRGGSFIKPVSLCTGWTARPIKSDLWAAILIWQAARAAFWPGTSTRLRWSAGALARATDRSAQNPFLSAQNVVLTNTKTADGRRLLFYALRGGADPSGVPTRGAVGWLN